VCVCACVRARARSMWLELEACRQRWLTTQQFEYRDLPDDDAPREFSRFS
jgi:hypothetical protein